MSELRIRLETSIDQFLYTYLRNERGISEKKVKTLMRDLKSDQTKLRKIEYMFSQWTPCRTFDSKDFIHLEGIGPSTASKAANGFNDAISLLKANNLIENSRWMKLSNKQRFSGKVKKKDTDNYIEEDYFSI